MSISGEIAPMMAGTTEADHGESWTHWAIFNRQQATRQCEAGDLALLRGEDNTEAAYELTGWQGHGCAAGGVFRGSPYIAIVTGSMILVRQYGGLDI